MQPILVNILHNGKYKNNTVDVKNSIVNNDSKKKDEKMRKFTNYLQKELEHNPFFLSF